MIKATNHKFEVTKKEKRKREEIVKRRKTEAIITKRCKNREEISLSSEKEENYDSNTVDDTDPN